MSSRLHSKHRTSPQRSVAVIDTWVTEAFPSGKCARALAGSIAPDHDVTVLSLAFEEPVGGGVTFRRLHALRRPGALLLPTFWIAAGVAYLWGRVRGVRYDAVVAVEGYSPIATVRYAHFCHAVHRDHVPRARGVRGIVQRVSDVLQLTGERLAYRHPRRVVAVSDGLAEDLQRAYPHLAGRIDVIPNFIDVERFDRPADFDRDAVRATFGIGVEDRLAVFVALGHFERKGLPEVFEAVARLQRRPGAKLHLLVVGGFPERVRQLRTQAVEAGIGDRVTFVGMVGDARPFYWAADAFVMPSRYETFSFVAFEAAAAGLPLVATPVYGVRDILADGSTGWLVSCDPDSVTAALGDLVAAAPDELLRRGRNARHSVQAFSRANFERRWRALLSDVLDE